MPAKVVHQMPPALLCKLSPSAHSKNQTKNTSHLTSAQGHTRTLAIRPAPAHPCSLTNVMVYAHDINVLRVNSSGHRHPIALNLLCYPASQTAAV